MRTTIDLPDELYRALKARAALNGVAFRQLVQNLIEQGLRSMSTLPSTNAMGQEPPPVIIPARGISIPAISHRKLNQFEEVEDEQKHDRST